MTKSSLNIKLCTICSLFTFSTKTKIKVDQRKHKTVLRYFKCSIAKKIVIVLYLSLDILPLHFQVAWLSCGRMSNLSCSLLLLLQSHCYCSQAHNCNATYVFHLEHTELIPATIAKPKQKKIDTKSRKPEAKLEVEVNWA